MRGTIIKGIHAFLSGKSMCSEGWLSEITPLTDVDKPEIGMRVNKPRWCEDKKNRKDEECSPSRVLRGVAWRGEKGSPPKKVGWRAVGGGAYLSSSPGEIIGGLVGTLVSKTWWKGARCMITLWTPHPLPSCLQAAFHEITGEAKWKEQRNWGSASLSPLNCKLQLLLFLFFFLSLTVQHVSPSKLG